MVCGLTSFSGSIHLQGLKFRAPLYTFSSKWTAERNGTTKHPLGITKSTQMQIS